MATLLSQIYSNFSFPKILGKWDGKPAGRQWVHALCLSIITQRVEDSDFTLHAPPLHPRGQAGWKIVNFCSAPLHSILEGGLAGEQESVLCASLLNPGGPSGWKTVSSCSVILHYISEDGLAGSQWVSDQRVPKVAPSTMYICVQRRSCTVSSIPHCWFFSTAGCKI